MKQTIKAGPPAEAARAFQPCVPGRTLVQVVSVNVGLPREVIWKGMTVQTGIFKDPVDRPVTISKLNLAGDRQADLTVHGGAEKAVYAYPAEHYEYWQKRLPEVPFSWGKFGENLTTEGLTEDALCVGDHLRVGSAVLMVTQPRMPCYKLALRFDRDDMIKLFLSSQRSGFYFSVIEEGEVRAGSEVEILSRDSPSSLGCGHPAPLPWPSTRSGTHSSSDERKRTTAELEGRAPLEGAGGPCLTLLLLRSDRHHSGSKHSTLHKIKEDVQFRKMWAERCGFGFEFPSVVPNVPKTAEKAEAQEAA